MVPIQPAPCSFNEMRPSSSDPSYLSAISAAVYSAMAAADPGCVWIMQAWLFFSDSGFWQPPQIKVDGVLCPAPTVTHSCALTFAKA